MRALVDCGQKQMILPLEDGLVVGESFKQTIHGCLDVALPLHHVVHRRHEIGHGC